MNKTSALLTVGFRPFFFITALIGVLNPTLWASIFKGYSKIGLATDAMFWHGHEMLFGFTGALIAGFLLTASANWTGKKPISGFKLSILITVFLIGQLSYFLPISLEYLFVISNLFLPCLAVMLFVMVKDHPRQRNVFIPILLSLSLAKIFHSYGHYFGSYSFKQYGEHLGVNLIRLLILLIAGRVVPFFTKKRLPQVKIEVPSILKPSSMVPLVLLLIPWPDSTPRYLLAALYLCSFCFILCQFFYWKPFETRKVPILWILHLGLIMVISSLLVDMFALYWKDLLVAKASLHLLMAGGLGCVSIGMMTRVSLGHTGRFINADKWMIIAFISVALGGLIRFLIPVFYTEHYIESVHHASGWWTLGFLIYLIKFTKVLFSKREGQG